MAIQTTKKHSKVKDLIVKKQNLRTAMSTLTNDTPFIKPTMEVFQNLNQNSLLNLSHIMELYLIIKLHKLWSIVLPKNI